MRLSLLLFIDLQLIKIFLRAKLMCMYWNWNYPNASTEKLDLIQLHIVCVCFFFLYCTLFTQGSTCKHYTYTDRFLLTSQIEMIKFLHKHKASPSYQLHHVFRRDASCHQEAWRENWVSQAYYRWEILGVGQRKQCWCDNGVWQGMST